MRKKRVTKRMVTGQLIDLKIIDINWIPRSLIDFQCNPSPVQSTPFLIDLVDLLQLTV